MADLVEQLSELLKSKNMMIATAESCTGGLLASSLTHRPGASSFFDRGFITYSNGAKGDMLEVSEVVLSSFGAVSAEAAQAMAKGAVDNSAARIALSTTGVAGPDGGTKKRPVGLVFIGYALKGGKSGSFEHRFEGDRRQIQTQSVIEAIKHAVDILEKAE